jgi:hypothetical protein
MLTLRFVKGRFFKDKDKSFISQELILAILILNSFKDVISFRDEHSCDLPF